MKNGHDNFSKIFVNTRIYKILDVLKTDVMRLEIRTLKRESFCLTFTLIYVRNAKARKATAF